MQNNDVATVKSFSSSAALPPQKSHIDVRFAKEDDTRLSLKNVRIDLPGNGGTLVDGVNLELKKGDRLIITGASGTGKSSLLKAIRDLWEDGAGEIVLPHDANIVAISQKAYMPNTGLRGVLSYPDKEGKFSDDELENTLKAVGLERLVQYIPGQQMKHAVSALLAGIEPGMSLEDAGKKLQETAQDIVKARVDLAQHMTEEQRGWLENGLREKIGACDEAKLDKMLDAVCGQIDRHLVQKLTDHLSFGIVPWVKSYTQGKEVDAHRARMQILQLGKQLEKQLKLFFNKKNLDARDVAWLTPEQISQISKSISDRLNQEIKPFLKERKGLLSGLFNSFADPVMHFPVSSRARTTAERIVSNIVLYMKKEVATGDVLSKRLSGGEQQRVAFARVLLHKPDIVILDEVTAALDKEAGSALYRDMVEKLKDTIMISVAHNSHIIAFHTLHAKLENKKLTVSPVALAQEPVKPAGPAPQP